MNNTLTIEAQKPAGLAPLGCCAAGRTGKGGSSWKGFWKLPNRGMVWLKVAATYRDGHNANIWAANLLNTPESAAAMRHMKRMCAWALNRAEKYGVNWRDAK